MTSSNEANCDIGRYFGLPSSPCLSIHPNDGLALTASLIETRRFNSQGQDVFLPIRDAYFLMIYLESATHADILPDGTRLPSRVYAAQSICLVDMETGPAISLRTDLRAITFVCPKALLMNVAQLSGTGSARLTCLRGKKDPVIAHLADALLPLFNQLDVQAPLLKHLAMALCAHLVHAYGLPDHANAPQKTRACRGCMNPDCSCRGPLQ